MTSGGPYAYSYTPTTTARVVSAQPAVGHVSTSPRELRDLTIAFAVLTVDIMFVIGSGALYLFTTYTDYGILQIALVAGTAALTAFVAHEMAHKISAQRRGYWAEFRMSPAWLLFSLAVSAYAGLLFAAPGATVIGGMGDKGDWGRTALAGPVTNMAFSTGFFLGAVGALYAHSGVAVALLYLAFINGWFATFNLIPFGPLDGRKVYTWSRSTWALTIVAAGVLAVISYYALTTQPLFFQ
jgi:Zn-dependent protease